MAEHDNLPLDPPQSFNVTLELISPEIAAGWLKLNTTNNRRLKETSVRKYVRSIQAGAWPFTADTIKFSEDGQLIDGQNRLTAIVRSGVTIPSLVATGLDRRVMPFLDAGSARSDADAIMIAELALSSSAAKDIAACANVKIAWENGVLVTAGQSANGDYTPTRAEKISWLESRPDFVKSVMLARKTYTDGFRMPVSGMGAAIDALRAVDLSAAEEFVGRLAHMEFTDADALRILVKRVQADKNANRARPTSGMTLFMLFRTWNAWREGERITRLQAGSTESGWASIPTPR